METEKQPYGTLVRIINSGRFGWCVIQHPGTGQLCARSGATIGYGLQVQAPELPYHAYLAGTRGEIVGFRIDWLDKGYAAGPELEDKEANYWSSRYWARLDFAPGQPALFSFAVPPGPKWPDAYFSADSGRSDAMILGYHHREEERLGVQACWDTYLR